MTATLLAPADLKDYVVVLRGSFEAKGVTRERFEVISSQGWPYGRIDSMVEARYLGLAPYDLLDTMAECGCGRKWQNDEARDAHKATCPAEVAKVEALKKRARKTKVEAPEDAPLTEEV